MFTFRKTPKRTSVSVADKIQLAKKKVMLQIENAKRIKEEKEQAEKKRIEMLHTNVTNDFLQELPYKNQHQLSNFKTKMNIPNYVTTVRSLNDNLQKTIVHVMNNNYGLGDFIWGSILLAQYAKYHNINFKIDMSMHHISKCLLVEPELLVRDNIESILYNWKDEDDIKLYSLLKQFIASNEPTFYISTNLNYNKNLVSQDIKNYINSCLCFKQEYYIGADINMEKYRVLHIRCKDDCFDTNFQDSNLILEIKKLNLSKDTVVISNNYSLKQKLNKLFGFYFIDKGTHHFASINGFAELETTIIEYLILSKSCHTFCFSYYNHGSGFSEQCSILNNIPYNVTILG
jgi:hypothetical protein